MTILSERELYELERADRGLSDVSGAHRLVNDGYIYRSGGRYVLTEEGRQAISGRRCSCCGHYRCPRLTAPIGGD